MKDNYYEEIKNNLIDEEVYSRVKDYSKERHKLETCYKTGYLLNEAGNHYGEGIIKKYSELLMVEVNKKYNERTLRRMRQFYRKFCNENWSPLATKLNWSQFTELLSINDSYELDYYINVATRDNLSKRDLRKKIKNTIELLIILERN